ncbi:M3 family metallopeptidase [Flammeovirga sp. MY04]|uniref:M3 family metallopeptidase n=1 Tax=Flammeovirga sp. MY04 TaxID=1191459 RepID=UPI0008060D06|nr:M3 family metallopeptidase [Flammeovirga sp. MY04]ANQ49712.1 M3 family metallopeptidase [Flammeovirga sp. MY04]
MKKTFRSIIGISSLFILLFGCDKASNNKSTTSDNMLLQEWEGPYGGTPAFDKMQVADLKDAIVNGIEIHLNEINEISNNTAPATFENTIVAMEKAGSDLDRVFTYYGIWRSNMSSPELRDIAKELAPIISDYSSKINQNDKLYQRIKKVHEDSQTTPLEQEAQRITDLYYIGFVMKGADLDAAKKKRYAEIDKELSTLYSDFSNNVLADEESYVVYLTDKQLSGLPESFVKSAAKQAEERGKKGQYAVLNTRSFMEPFLTYSDERELRKQVWTNYIKRGDNRDEHDNNKIIAQILKLRDERVKLMGYANYATWRLQDRMAKNPANAMDLMEKVWAASVKTVHKEVKDMQAVANKRGDKITIEPWDYRYYAEKVRKAKYDLDSDEVKQYLQLEKLREGMFMVAGELFGFEFKALPKGKVPVFHEDVRVWEVLNKENGELVGLWYLDPYARKGKRSGAWATTYRSFTSFEGKKIVLASNNSNFIKPAPGEVSLVSWSDAETFFHEFGHALHFLSANVKYPKSNSGVRDYTEFQSQLLERWLPTDKVINGFLTHVKTGKPMPQELVKKIKAAATFNQGFSTTEYLASALMDMKYHTTDVSNIDPITFEKETLDKLGLPKEIVMRHRSTQFGHVFSGEGYAAAYYGYLWADVLTSDAAELFEESPKGYYDKEIAEKLVKYLFAPRNAIDPAEAYRMFRGRDADYKALMRDRGFM